MPFTKADSRYQLPLFHRRVPASVFHSASSSPRSGPARWVCPNSTLSASGASTSATRAIASRPARRSSWPVSTALNGPIFRRFNAATTAGIVTRPTTKRLTRPLPVARLQTERDMVAPRASAAPEAPSASPAWKP